MVAEVKRKFKLIGRIIMSNNNTDIKDCCGAFAEIGSIIQPDDTELSFPISFASAQHADDKLAEIKAYVAEKFGDSIVVEVTEQDDCNYTVTISFSCTAEKMIFEMNLRHLMA